MNYIVETRMGNTWENCWTEDGNVLVTFDTLEAAQKELAGYLDDLAHFVEIGHLTDFNPKDYRIVQSDDNDMPNVCPHDGTRTRLIALFPDSSLEQCPHCKRSFNFYSD